MDFTAYFVRFLWQFITGWFPAKFVDILDERSKEVWRQLIFILLILTLIYYEYVL